MLVSMHPYSYPSVHGIFLSPVLFLRPMEEVHGVEEGVVVLLLSTNRLLVLHVPHHVSVSTELYGCVLVLVHTSAPWCWKEETKLLSLFISRSANRALFIYSFSFVEMFSSWMNVTQPKSLFNPMVF